MSSRHASIVLLAAISLSAGPTSVQAQQKSVNVSDAGKLEYQAHCAVCHGLTGQGDGPFSQTLKSGAPSLTTLAKRNGGVFPVVRVYGMIDGREQVAGHGPSDMPIWGDRYSLQVGQGPFVEGMHEDIRGSREALVRTRILLLTEYISRLQEK